MSEQNTTCCPCEPVQSARLPLTGITIDVDTSSLPTGGLSREEIVQIVREELQGQSGGLSRQWQSDWFNVAANGTYVIQHNLGLQAPDSCDVRLVARVKTASVGWEAGEIIFADGSNYNGAANSSEVGWAISLSENSAHISLGNNPVFLANHKQGGHGALPKANVECRLVIDY